MVLGCSDDLQAPATANQWWQVVADPEPALAQVLVV